MPILLACLAFLILGVMFYVKSRFWFREGARALSAAHRKTGDAKALDSQKQFLGTVQRACADTVLVRVGHAVSPPARGAIVYVYVRPDEEK